MSITLFSNELISRMVLVPSGTSSSARSASTGVSAFFCQKLKDMVRDARDVFGSVLLVRMVCMSGRTGGQRCKREAHKAAAQPSPELPLCQMVSQKRFIRTILVFMFMFMFTVSACGHIGRWPMLSPEA
eukprot:1056472-Prymnesium_polylepis.2